MNRGPTIGVVALFAMVGAVGARAGDRITPSSPESIPMSTPASPKRTAEIVKHLNAPVEAVWKALTDADELTRWFPLEARVKPGAGGSMFCSWRNEYKFDSPITIWEPNKHLRVLWGPADAPESELFGVDYFLHAQDDGTTVLRLVHFGFGTGPQWDGMYDGVCRGWGHMLFTLDNYLSRHRGTPRNAIYLSRKVIGGDKSAAFNRFCSKDGGLFADSSILHAKPGERFRAKLVTGEDISGTVRRATPGGYFEALLDSLDYSTMCIQTDPSKDGQGGAIALTVSTYGLDPARFAAMETQWSAALERSANVGQ